MLAKGIAGLSTKKLERFVKNSKMYVKLFESNHLSFFF